MPLNFPNSPTANQVYTDTTSGNRYTWDATNNVWRYTPNTASLTVTSVTPTNPTIGSMWWNTDLGRLYIYYNDGDSSQWVEASPASGTIDVEILSGYVNVASDLAKAAFTQSNAAYTQSNVSFTQSNAAYTQSNAAYVAASTKASTGKAIAMAMVFGG